MTAPGKPSGLVAALSAMQAELPTVGKASTATVPTKAGGKYTYTFATLADVAQAVYPLLGRHGLAFVCSPTLRGAQYVLTARLEHVSGEVRSGVFPLPATSDAQTIGSALTYGRRYLLGCLTGVVTDDDDDGAKATQAHKAKRAEQRPEPEPESDPAEYGELSELIAGVTTPEELEAVRVKIAGSAVQGRARDQLRVAWSAKQKQITEPAA